MTGQHCSGEHCVTCSDEAVAVSVLRLLPDDMAEVATAAGPEVVSVALVDPQPGEAVLVHAGEAIAVLRPVAEQQPAVAQRKDRS